MILKQLYLCAAWLMFVPLSVAAFAQEDAPEKPVEIQTAMN